MKLIRDKETVISVHVTSDEGSFYGLQNSDSSSSGEEFNDWSDSETSSKNSKLGNSNQIMQNLEVDSPGSEDENFPQNHNCNSRDPTLQKNQDSANGTPNFSRKSTPSNSQS